MPITPLHLGLLAPINHFAKGKVSSISFIIVNLWIDGPAILEAVFGQGSYDHSGHQMWAALMLSGVVAVFGYRSRKWIYGAFLGGITHILLDMLVHADMQPFWPLIEGNPFYMGWMQPLSLILLGLCAWLTLQIVSGIRERARKYLKARSS